MTDNDYDKIKYTIVNALMKEIEIEKAMDYLERFMTFHEGEQKRAQGKILRRRRGE